MITWLHRRLTREESSFTLGLIRIGLVLLLWTRWAAEVMPYLNLSGERLALSASFYLSSTLTLLGLWTPVSSAALALTMVSIHYYFGLVRGVEPWTHHHTWLLISASVLVAASPSGRSLSLDRWWALRRQAGRGGPAPSQTTPRVWLDLIAWQVSLVYFWSAVDKTQWGFLNGERLQHSLLYLYWGSDPLPGPALSQLFELGCWLAADVVVLLEYALPIGLFFARGRRWLVPMGIVLHAVFYVLLPVGPFSLTMLLLYLAYYPAGEVEAAVRRLLGPESPASPPAQS